MMCQLALVIEDASDCLAFHASSLQGNGVRRQTLLFAIPSYLSTNGFQSFLHEDPHSATCVKEFLEVVPQKIYL